MDPSDSVVYVASSSDGEVDEVCESDHHHHSLLQPCDSMDILDDSDDDSTVTCDSDQSSMQPDRDDVVMTGSFGYPLHVLDWTNTGNNSVVERQGMMTQSIDGASHGDSNHVQDQTYPSPTSPGSILRGMNSDDFLWENISPYTPRTDVSHENVGMEPLNSPQRVYGDYPTVVDMSDCGSLRAQTPTERMSPEFPSPEEGDADAAAGPPPPPIPASPPSGNSDDDDVSSSHMGDDHADIHVIVPYGMIRDCQDCFVCGMCRTCGYVFRQPCGVSASVPRPPPPPSQQEYLDD